MNLPQQPQIQLSTEDFEQRMKAVELQKSYTILAEVTAYNENDGETYGTTMANGQTVYYGCLANDKLPFGTKVIIDGETFVVADRFGGGHPIEKFDMYLPSRGDCDRFGRQWKTVKVVETEE